MLTQLVAWLNWIADTVAGVVFAPIAWLPERVSITVISILTGVVMLFVFKHTSHQGAIKWTRNQIKANLLALSLFKDDFRVGLRAQGRLVLAGFRLLVLSVGPMLVMLVPMCLLLGQLSLWYQLRPLQVGEEAVVTVQLLTNQDGTLPDIKLQATSPITASAGPVRVPAKQMACWNILATEAGLHGLVFEVDGNLFTKEFAVGNDLMPVSQMRPAQNVLDVVMHPHEAPFSSDSPVQSIEIDYSQRISLISGSKMWLMDWLYYWFGSNTWLAYWFLVSMVAAFVAIPVLKVNI